MDREEHAAALRVERDGLVLSPDRPAKERRLAEIDEQLKEFEDTSDRAPRERAVPKRRGDG